MKYIYCFSFLILSLSCSKKSNEILNNSQNLNAYEPIDANKQFRSIVSHKEFNKNSILILDKKEYQLSQFESIVDTISTEYEMKILRNNNNKIIKLIRK